MLIWSETHNIIILCKWYLDQLALSNYIINVILETGELIEL